MDLSVKVGKDLLGGLGRGGPFRVGRGGRQRGTQGTDEGQGHGVVRAADPQGGAPGGDRGGGTALVLQHHGQGTGPVFLRQSIGCGGDVLRIPLHHIHAGDQDGQGLSGVTGLDGVDILDGPVQTGVGGQAVDRLGGDGHQFPRLHGTGGLGDGVHGVPDGVHFLHGSWFLCCSIRAWRTRPSMISSRSPFMTASIL